MIFAMSRHVQAPFRDVNIAAWDVDVREAPDGAIYLRPLEPLPTYPARLTDRLDKWAALDPARTFLGQRDERGEWRILSYGEFRDSAREVAQALLDCELSAGRPIAICSGNDVEHALLATGAMYAGIPYAPISPAYSLLSKDFGKLRHVFGLLTPGLVFANDGAAFQRAIDAVVPQDTRLVVTRNPIAGRSAELFSRLTGRPATSAVDVAHGRVTADTVAKILFTSGSAGIPKGVINTHRMLCSNQEMLRTVFRVFADEPPQVCDWLPWNHTFGGNHNFGLALYNGGSFYVDNGKPVPGLFAQTVKNLSEISPTVYFNVPKGYEMLVRALREDSRLRESFFRRLKMNFYAAASLPQHIWDELDAISVETCGERIRMLTGLGMTETAPFAISASTGTAKAGFIGLPVPGVEVKLAPVSGKLEVRYRGPNVTPGFWWQPELTADAFDEEGFFRSGDAVRFHDCSSPRAGLVFDGRLAEDFKLSSGTWVSVGPLRARFIAHFAPYVKDVVIAGYERDEVTALIFPDWDACGDLRGQAAIAMADGKIRAIFTALLTSFAEGAAGSSNRVERAVILEEPASLDAGEITDKGSINQRAVLARRARIVDDLYVSPAPTHVIVAQSSYWTQNVKEHP